MTTAAPAHYEEEPMTPEQFEEMVEDHMEEAQEEVEEMFEELAEYGIENVNISANDFNFETTFNGEEVATWFGERMAAFEENHMTMEALVEEWMNSVVEVSEGPAMQMEQLVMERHELEEEAIMEAAEYVSQHVMINGQTLCDFVEDIAAQMAAEYPEEFPAEQVSAVQLFGLNRIKVDDTVVSDMDVTFHFNENYLWDWLTEIEEESAALDAAAYDNVMQLADEVESSLMDAYERDQGIAVQSYELDTRTMSDSINWIFDNITVDGVSAGEMFPEQRANAIADSLEMVREGYEMLGYYAEPTQAELDSRAVVDAFEAERMAEMEMYSLVETQAQSSTNMLPFVGGAALLAGGLYLFSRKNEQKSNQSPFLSQ